MLTNEPSRSVDYISFSAHVDYTQNAKFIDDVMPAHLILVHGEANNMARLRAALKTKYAERKDDIQIYTPRNVEVVKLKFRGERMARALGTLAAKAPAASEPFSGLLVSKDFTYTLLSPKDLKDFTGLTTSVIMQRQTINVAVTWDLVRWHLQGMYGTIQEGVDASNAPTMRVRVVHLPCHFDLTQRQRSCRRSTSRRAGSTRLLSNGSAAWRTTWSPTQSSRSFSASTALLRR